MKDIESAVKHRFDPGRSHSENMSRIRSYLDQFGSPRDGAAYRRRDLAIEDALGRRMGTVAEQALRVGAGPRAEHAAQAGPAVAQAGPAVRIDGFVGSLSYPAAMRLAQAEKLQQLARHHINQRNNAEARRLLSQCMDIFERMHDEFGQASVFDDLGVIHVNEGKDLLSQGKPKRARKSFELAKPLYYRSLQAFSRLGPQRTTRWPGCTWGCSASTTC
jgi:hypothetical protein